MSLLPFFCTDMFLPTFALYWNILNRHPGIRRSRGAGPQCGGLLRQQMPGKGRASSLALRAPHFDPLYLTAQALSLYPLRFAAQALPFGPLYLAAQALPF
jgi:hypothetical protein